MQLTYVVMVSLLDKPASYLELGKRIKELRKRRHLSQRELGEAVFVSEGYFGGVEIGRRRPEKDILKRTAAVLGTDYTELFVLAGYMERVPEPNPSLVRLRRFPRHILDQLDVIGQALWLREQSYASDDIKAVSAEDAEDSERQAGANENAD